MGEYAEEELANGELERDEPPVTTSKAGGDGPCFVDGLGGITWESKFVLCVPFMPRENAECACDQINTAHVEALRTRDRMIKEWERDFNTCAKERDALRAEVKELKDLRFQAEGRLEAAKQVMELALLDAEKLKGELAMAIAKTLCAELNHKKLMAEVARLTEQCAWERGEVERLSKIQSENAISIESLTEKLGIAEGKNEGLMEERDRYRKALEEITCWHAYETAVIANRALLPTMIPPAFKAISPAIGGEK